jgi:hypothetical protein
LKGEAGRKSWRCREGSRAQVLPLDRHQPAAGRKSCGRPKEVWRKPDGFHQGGSPADINVNVARAAFRLAVRAAGSVGKRPTVMQ